MALRSIFLSCLLALLCAMFSFAQSANLDLIPKPNKIIPSEGSLDLSEDRPLYYHEEFESILPLLQNIPDLTVTTSEIVKRSRRHHTSGIRVMRPLDSDKLAADAFKIIIDKNGILIKSHQPEHTISAIYTLLQLRLLQGESRTLPYVTIEDQPRFGYRGLHLDVSRHFMPTEFVKKYIDIMALYKFNHFHWHLTDGAGWRLEVKQYPELTQKAAWRTHSSFYEWEQNGKQYLQQGHPNAYGGYYTQEQVRDIVDYAAQRGITIIPEIEMPGHAEEVLAVYPHLSCTGHPYTQNEFCIGNPETFTFLKNVLDEVIELFPSNYIHIGGDEADKSHWKTCPKCQALKEEQGLQNEEELQSYAIRQMDEYLQSKGRKLIGWDEILEGGLSKGATVMSWRGEEGGIKAANAGHDVIMTPLSHLYFDFYQFDPRTQPAAFEGYIPLKKVYAYDPIPASIDESQVKHVLGAQANLWTEYMQTPQQVEYMAFPRALALAEVNWTYQEARDFEDFRRRLQSHYPILQSKEVNYYRPSFHVTHKTDFDPTKRSNTVTLASEQYDGTIRYTTDDTTPSSSATRYTTPIELAKTTTLKAASFIDSVRVSPVASIVLDVHKAIGKRVKYNSPWQTSYPAQGEETLTNGQKGGLSYHDGQWQGFTQDLDVVIDLDRREEINSVAADFMQMPGPGVFFPGEFTVLVSDNGKAYREIGMLPHQDAGQQNILDFKTFKIAFEKPVMARFIKIQATNVKKGFLFVDEIVIY